MRKEAFITLGLQPTASPAEIKATYRRLVKIYHPDRFKNADEATLRNNQEKFLLITEAYDLLTS